MASEIDWEGIDEELRQELDAISLSSSLEHESPSPQQLLPHVEPSDVRVLFGGYSDMTGVDCDLDDILSDLPSVCQPSDNITDPLDKHKRPAPAEMTSIESPPDPIDDGCHGSDNVEMVVHDLDSVSSAPGEDELHEQVLERELQERELELNALIEKNQRIFEERRQLLADRERCKAVVKIQAHVRGHMTRKMYSEMKLRNKMAGFIQAAWRGHRVRLRVKMMRQSAVLIENCWIHHKARVSQQKKLLAAVLTIQTYWRTHHQRKLRSIIIIQRAWKSYTDRCKKVRLKLDDGAPDPLSDANGLVDETIPDPLSTPQLCDETSHSSSALNDASTVTNGHQPDHLPHNSESCDSSQLQNNSLSTMEERNSIEAPSNNTVREISPSIVSRSSESITTLQPAQSPSKLTISKRIQTALKLVNQSNSTHSLDGREERDTVRESRSFSLPATTRKSLTNSEWSQLRLDKEVPTSVLGNESQQSEEESVNSKSNANGLKKDVANQDNVSGIAKDDSEPTSTEEKQSAVAMGEGIVTAGVDSVEREALELAAQRERRQVELEVAQQSRLRMSRMISHDEIQQVSKQKKSHGTYSSELEFAAQPLSPRAWCGLVAERLDQWKKQHRKWTFPKPIQASAAPSLPPPQQSGTQISQAQLLAASPKGTPLEQVAMVVMYRSRHPVDLTSLSKCSRLASLSLTKCGLVSLSKLSSCANLKEIKVQSNSIEHVDLGGLVELSDADLSDNRLASIHGLERCSGLVNLDLSENRVARLAGLEGCGSLQSLNVDSNLIINSKGLSSVRLLQVFSCAENHLPKVEGLDHCNLLQLVNLSQNNLQQPPVLRDHVLLRQLYLEGNSLSDLAPLSGSWLPLLQTLSLANNCIAELSPLNCMVMLGQLDVSNNSLFDLPVLLQSVRGCYQLRSLVVTGNPVAEEPRLRHYLTKALPCLERLDNQQLRAKGKLPEAVCSSSAFLLCKRQILEQDEAKQTKLAGTSGDGPPTPGEVVQSLDDKARHCKNYQSLLIRHLREHESLEMSTGPHKSTQRQRLAHETRAVVRIQSLWRGYQARLVVGRMRALFNRSATVIQAAFRGYILRDKLRRVLEAASYSKARSDGNDSGDSIDFEEEVIVDYLDESALDNELLPLSPREPRQRLIPSPLHSTESPAPHKPPLIPVYTLPGCVDAEVSFEEWKQQQAVSLRQGPRIDPIKNPAVTSAGGGVRGNPLAAWGSCNDLEEESLEDNTANEWGILNPATVELMKRRNNRQKKLQAKASRRKKLADPDVRLAAFRKKAPPTHVLKAQEQVNRESVSPASVARGSQDLVYKWVNNHTIVHEREPLHKTSDHGAWLPPMAPRVLAGHPPQLINSSNDFSHLHTREINGSSNNNYRS